jgi:hypothetical protein
MHFRRSGDALLSEPAQHESEVARSSPARAKKSAASIFADPNTENAS